MLYDLTSLLTPFMLPSQCIIWHRGQGLLFNKVNIATRCTNEGHGVQFFGLAPVFLCVTGQAVDKLQG